MMMQANHIAAVSVSGKSFNHSVVFSHNENTIEIQLPWLTKASVPISHHDRGIIDLFLEINQYWAHLPFVTQGKIFDIYDRLAEALGEKGDLFDGILGQKINPVLIENLVNELYEYHKLEDLMTWLKLHSNVHLPTGMKNEYIPENEGNTTREKTYLRDEYHYLIALSLSLRTLLPVWGPFIQSTRRIFGSELKEYEAYKLIRNTGYYSNHGMRRLHAYVESKIPDDYNINGTIMYGIPSEDYPEYLTAGVVLRRLCVVKLNNPENDAMIARWIHSTIQNYVNTTGRATNIAPDVGDKKSEPNNGGNEENKTSAAESYNMHGNIPSGEVVAIRNEFLDADGKLSFDYFKHNCKRICPDITDSVIHDSFQCGLKMGEDPVLESRYMIARLVLRDIIPPEAMDHNLLLTSQCALAIAQACLWHRGFKDLALLMTAGIFSEGEVLKRTHIQKEQKLRLAELTKYAPEVDGKVAAVCLINAAAEELEGYKWRIRAPSSWYESMGYGKTINTTKDIRVQLADLAILIMERGF
jgi:hypothetical protein